MNKFLIIIFGILFATGASAWEFKPNFASNNNNLNYKSNDLINVQMKVKNQTDMNIEAVDKFNKKKKELDDLIKEIKTSKQFDKSQLELFDFAQQQWEDYVVDYVDLLTLDFKEESKRSYVQAKIKEEIYDRKIKELKEDLESLEEFKY